LEDLELNFTNIISTKGIQYFSELEYINIKQARNLESLDSTSKCTSLTKIVLSNCKKISDWDGILNHKDLLMD